MAGTDVAAPPARWDREYPAEAASVRQIRRDVAAFAHAHGAEERQVADLTLAVSEAATNAVVHAFTNAEPGRLRLVAEPSDGALHVMVADDGHGMRPRGDSPGLGLGVPTIAQLTTSLDIRPAERGSGTEVHMEFAVPGLRAPAPARSPEAWRLELLAEVARLAGTGWPGEGLEELVALLVPAVADACALDIVEADGPRRVAGHVGDDEDGDLSAWLAARAPLQDALQSALPALRGGRAHVTELSDEANRELIQADGDLARFAQLGLHWWVNVPLTDGGVLLGSLGLGLAAHRPDPYADLAFYAALGERAARGLGTTHLVDELRRTRRRLERILSVLSEAITVQDRDGRMVYANEAAARLLGARSVDEVLGVAPGELAGRFDMSHEDGSPVRLEELPGFTVLTGDGAPSTLLTRSVHRATGIERWLLTKATLLEDDEPYAVNIIEDITEAKNAEVRQRLLAQAGEALASDGDPRAALARIASLAVPVLADWCAIDVTDRRVAEAGLDVPDPRAALSAPIAVAGQPVGALRLATRPGGRTLDAARRSLAEELAARAASAVARLR